MVTLMNDLHQDHQHISVLLTILKNKLATLEVGSLPNFNLMADVVGYLIDYGDLYHHRKEDILYALICDRYPQTAVSLSQQLAEHDELKTLTTDLKASVDRALIDSPLPLSVFVKQLKRFVDKQSHHLNHEETRVFPLIEQHMTASDWRSLRRDLPCWNDPLPGGSLEERYNKLYEAMIDDLA